ncbi:Ig-like domain-containing protein [Chitinophaga nivalis]|uniref:T9SS type A sorting domain-containing protein n=1 Tax=Chitinophaga nivalis TaxID=2991709 RepID=A0ABT3IWZ8_9BACT|nr:T9SS type A sorting domain-containing protein [Chitinophaga nivalis]MCW3462063.1 T9SS type A sorting domain-containing protein [Chitinophaga nivalis]MCW3488245.1 T9SS type A sorting domain-containing protein [Chitinophaga nivalis]
MKMRLYLLKPFVCLLMTCLYVTSKSHGQAIYAGSQSNRVNGNCFSCSVSNPENPVNSNSLDDYSVFVMNGVLSGVSVEQTLIFSGSSTIGCDSLVIGIGSSNSVLHTGLFSGVTVQTYNGTLSNNDAQTVTAGIVQLTHNGTRAAILLKPARRFDRVKLTLSSVQQGQLTGFRLYYARRQSVAPAAPVATPGNAIICTGDTATFTVPAVSGTSISWYAGATGDAPLATGNTFRVKPSKNTTYYVAAISGSCSSVRVPVTVTLLPKPAAPVAGGPSGICIGDSAVLTATGNNIRWYNTATGDGLLYSGSPFVVKPATTTTYYAQVESDGCTSKRTGVTVTVRAKPAVPVTTRSTTICKGDGISITATGLNVTWHDSLTGGSLLYSGKPFRVNPDTATTYYAQVNNNGCSSDRVGVTISVKPKPVVREVSGYLNICNGDSVLLTAVGYNIKWYETRTGGAPLFVGDSLYVGPAYTTSYYAQADSNGCNSIRVEAPVTVYPSPQQPFVVDSIISIFAGDTVLLEAFSNYGNTIQWYETPNGGVPVFTGSPYLVIPDVTTTYYAGVDSGVCSSNHVGIRVVVNERFNTAAKATNKWIQPVGAAVDNESYFFPNPTTGYMQLRTKQETGGSRVLVTDVQGRPVYREVMNNNSLQLPVLLPDGFYFIQVQTKNGKVIRGKVLLTR